MYWKVMMRRLYWRGKRSTLAKSVRDGGTGAKV